MQQILIRVENCDVANCKYEDDLASKKVPKQIYCLDFHMSLMHIKKS
jgi:hypothetical protein